MSTKYIHYKNAESLGWKKAFLKIDSNSHNTVRNVKYHALKLQVICCPSVKAHKTEVKRIVFLSPFSVFRLHADTFDSIF